MVNTETIKKRKEDLKRQRNALAKETKDNTKIGEIVTSGGVTLPVVILGVRRQETKNKSFNTIISAKLYGSFEKVQIHQDYGEKKSDNEIELNVLERMEKGSLGVKPVYQTVDKHTIRIGDEIELSLYSKLALHKSGGNMTAGDFAYITGIMPVFNSEKNRVYWNCSKAIHEPKIGTNLDVLQIIEDIPHSSLDIRKIITPYPVPKSEDKERKEWSEEEKEAYIYLLTNRFIPVWKSDETHDEDDSGVALEKPEYPASEQTWAYERTEGGLAQKVRVLIGVCRWNHAENISEFSLIQLTLLENAVQAFGISNPQDWKSLAQYHVPYMRYGVRAFTSHEKTLQDQINTPVNDTEYAFTLNMVGVRVFVDLAKYIRTDCLPVTYEHVVEKLGGQVVDSQYANKNQLPKIIPGEVFNLNEHKGDLGVLQDSYDFYAMLNYRLTKRGRKLLNEWGSDAAEKCSVDMAGETDELGLPEIRVVVYFAVRRPVEKEESPAPDDSAEEEEEKTVSKAKRARVTKK